MSPQSLSLFLFSIFNFLSYAQRLERESDNPTILPNKNGFLITDVITEGKQKVFKMVQYDKNLKPLDSLMQPVEKERYILKAYSYGYEVRILYNLLGRKGAFLKVDSSLKKISFEEYEQDSPAFKEFEDAYKKQVPDNFYNYYGQFERSIEVGDRMFRLNSVDDKLVINGYKMKPSTLFQAYTEQWQLELPKHERSSGYCFYIGTNERAFMYFAKEENKKREEYIYCFNSITGKLIYELKLELKDPKTKTILSDVFINKEDQSVFIAGGYYEDDQKKKNATLTGYFTMLVDVDGKITKEKCVKLQTPVIKGIREHYFDKKALRFQKITKNTKGNYQLIAENILLDPFINSANAVEEGAVLRGVSFETYGFTFLEIDRDLNVLDSVFQPARKASEGTLLPGVTLFEGIQDLTFKVIIVYYDLSYCISNPSQTRMIYVTPKRQFYEVKRNGKELSVVPCKEINEAGVERPLFFEEDESSYYVFLPSKKKFILEKKHY